MAVSSMREQVLASGLVQPDQTTCGSCVLVVARAFDNPFYAGFLVNGVNSQTGEQASGTIQNRFEQQVLAMHRVTSGVTGSDGRWQLPWPQALGTSPWALAREMTTQAGESGSEYHAHLILPGQQAQTFMRIVSLAATGHVIPVYVGNRWSPRHVVLVLPGTDLPQDQVLIYDPASGHRYPIDGRDFSGGSLHVAGWPIPWVVVVPT